MSPGARGARARAENPSQPPPAAAYPVQFDVDYPDRELNRVTTFFRLFTVIPILIVLAAVGRASYHYAGMMGAWRNSARF